MVKATWKNNGAEIIEDLSENSEEEHRDETRDRIQSFLDSVHIKRLNFQAKGKIDVPRFNVYADGQLILDDDVWFYLRKTLASLTYTSPMLGRAHTAITPCTCAICHGVDHPTGMCEFPEKKGWNGPTVESIESQQNKGNPNRSTRNSRQLRS
jgi:hypothetical protein